MGTVSIPEHHIWFHNIFGRITTIRTAIWELSQHELSPEAQQMQKVASKELELLLADLEQIREKVYTKLDT